MKTGTEVCNYCNNRSLEPIPRFSLLRFYSATAMQPESVDKNKAIDFFSLHPSESADQIGGSGRAKQAWALVHEGQDLLTSDSLSAH